MVLEISVLDTDFKLLGIIDRYTSFVWTERYSDCGEFELLMDMDVAMYNLLKIDRYISIPNSSLLMIIEEVTVDDSQDEGDTLTIAGRTISSILDRRVVWGQKILTGSFQNGVQTLLSENVISATNLSRRISLVQFQSNSDAGVTSETIDAQFEGDNILEILETECQKRELGFVMTFNDATNKFVFMLYKGVDRSFNQNVNPYVVFSPQYENLASSMLYETKRNLKNAAWVKGETVYNSDDTQTTYTEEATSDSSSGLARREMSVNAADMRRKLDDGTEQPESTYRSQLRTKGTEELAETQITKAFDGDVDVIDQFVYGKDFFLGDLVQTVNEYDIEGVLRVTEMVITCDSDGYNAIPTFTAID